MQWLDKIFVNQSFQKDATGKTLFYPWGFFGKGYLVENEAAEQVLRRFIRVSEILMLVGVIGAFILNPVWGVIALPVSVGFFWLALRKMVAKQKLKIAKSSKYSLQYLARSISYKRLVLVILSLTGIILLAIVVLVAGAGDPDAPFWSMIFALIVFVPVLIWSVYLLCIKRRQDGK